MLNYLKGCKSFGCVLVTEAPGSVQKGMYGVRCSDFLPRYWEEHF